MPIDLQKLEQKFNALFEDENTVAEFEQWLEARNVKPALQQTPCTTHVCPKCGNMGRCEPRTLESPDGQECDCGQIA